MAMTPPPSINDWVVDSKASNHTTPNTGNLSSIRPITSVGNTVILGPFYINNILLTLDII
jgi:hypothetical protein